MRRFLIRNILSIVLAFGPGLAFAASQTIVVALGASQTFGKGVERSETYPARLEAILKASGRNVRVFNAGINGDTTGGMLARLNKAVPNGTKIVILQPGSNDKRQGSMADREGNISEIENRLSARGIQVIMMENMVFRGMERGPDGQHLTPEGYRSLAEQFAPQVESVLAP